MPADAVYITAIREPFAQVKSMFNYYNFQNIIGIRGDDPFEEYLTHLEKYERIYESHEAAGLRFCIPDGFPMYKNLMSFILGFPNGFLDGKPDMASNVTFIRQWLKHIDDRFDLVMITEYFHESLVLLRRKMCWELPDILHVSKNVGNYTYRQNQRPHLVSLYRSLSNVDYILYDHFNRTFWSKIKLQGADFRHEVRHFASVLGNVNTFCNGIINKTTTTATYNVAPSPWNGAFTVGKDFCVLMNLELFDEVKEKYDHSLPFREQPRPNKYFC